MTMLDTPTTATDARLIRAIGVRSATLLVITNVIGSAIFLTPGVMAATLPSEPLLLLAWVAGGVIALCGGLTYAEMGAMDPRSGGRPRQPPAGDADRREDRCARRAADRGAGPPSGHAVLHADRAADRAAGGGVRRGDDCRHVGVRRLVLPAVLRGRDRGSAAQRADRAPRRHYSADCHLREREHRIHARVTARGDSRR